MTEFDRSANRKLLLIGGTGRSGTTVLRRSLARHPSIGAAPIETRFLVDPDGVVDFWLRTEQCWTPYHYAVAVDRLRSLFDDVTTRGALARIGGARGGSPSESASTAASKSQARRLISLVRSKLKSNRFRPRYFNLALEEWFPGFEARVEELMDALIAFEYEGRWNGMSAGQPSVIVFGPPHGADVTSLLREFIADALTMFCPDHPVFVEDTPTNLVVFPHLHALYPDSFLIHMSRDPRDVVASYVTRKWAPSDARQSAQIVREVLDRWEAARSEVPSSAYIGISLEQLVAAPEATLRNVLERAGLEWDPVVLDEQWSPASFGRWKRDLDAASIAAVESELAHYLDGQE